MKCSLQMFPLPEPERSRDREQGNIEGKSEKWGALHFLPSFLYQKSVSVFSFFCHLSYFRVSCSSAFTSFASACVEFREKQGENDSMRQQPERDSDQYIHVYSGFQLYPHG